MTGINNINTMSAIEKLSSTEATNSTANAKKALGQEDFLKLLTTQMSQQDPMNPSSSADFIGQMAQIGTVDGIGKLQQSLAGISAGVFSNQALQASTMVGRNVFIPSNKGMLTQNGLSGAVASDYKLYDLNVKITDEKGKTIKEIKLGEQNPGVTDFKWDGTGNDGKPYPAGQYKMAATATINGKATNLQTLAFANVNSVTLGQGDSNVLLNLGELGTAPLYDVWKIS